MHFTQRSLPHTTAELSYATGNVADLLFAILTSLARIRGAQSYLFSSLLQKSGSILGLDTIPQELTPDMPSDLDCQGRFAEWEATLTNPPLADEQEDIVDNVRSQAPGPTCGISQGL